MAKWPKNSMQFTLGMSFLGVLGQFYRNRKGLIIFEPLILSESYLNVSESRDSPLLGDIALVSFGYSQAP